MESQGKGRNMTRPKVNGVIRNRIRNAFERYLKDGDAGIILFASRIAYIADISVQSKGNANIMYEAIVQEGNWYAEQKKETEKNRSKDTSENQKEDGR